MVERITGNESSVLQNLQTRQTETVEEVNRKAADESAKVVSLKPFNDTATVSAQAKRLLEAERFGRLAQQVPESFDYDKVSRLREMVQHGRINELLQEFDNNTLADSLINSPASAFLR